MLLSIISFILTYLHIIFRVIRSFPESDNGGFICLKRHRDHLRKEGIKKFYSILKAFSLQPCHPERTKYFLLFFYFRKTFIFMSVDKNSQLSHTKSTCRFFSLYEFFISTCFCTYEYIHCGFLVCLYTTH